MGYGSTRREAQMSHAHTRRGGRDFGLPGGTVRLPVIRIPASMRRCRWKVTPRGRHPEPTFAGTGHEGGKERNLQRTVAY